MLIVAGMPNQPAKFMLRGIHKSQQATMGRPMNPMVQSACLEMVLKPMDNVTFAEEQMRTKLSQFAIPTTIPNGLPPMMNATSTMSLIEL